MISFLYDLKRNQSTPQVSTASMVLTFLSVFVDDDFDCLPFGCCLVCDEEESVFGAFGARMLLGGLLFLISHQFKNVIIHINHVNVVLLFLFGLVFIPFRCCNKASLFVSSRRATDRTNRMEF